MTETETNPKPDPCREAFEIFLNEEFDTLNIVVKLIRGDLLRTWQAAWNRRDEGHPPIEALGIRELLAFIADPKAVKYKDGEDWAAWARSRAAFILERLPAPPKANERADFPLRPRRIAVN